MHAISYLNKACFSIIICTLYTLHLYAVVTVFAAAPHSSLHPLGVTVRCESSLLAAPSDTW